MSVKLLKTGLVTLSLLTLTNCSLEPEIRYVDKPYRVNVPVKCVVPDGNCSFDRGTLTEVVDSLLKHNEEICK